MGIRSTLNRIWAFIYKKPNDVNRDKSVKRLVDRRRNKLYWLRSIGRRR